jgi:hypothetical protein
MVDANPPSAAKLLSGQIIVSLKAKSNSGKNYWQNIKEVKIL